MSNKKAFFVRKRYSSSNRSLWRSRLLYIENPTIVVGFREIGESAIKKRRFYAKWEVNDG